MSHPTAIEQHQEHEDHGSTPAAWTLVVIITIAFIVGTLGVMLGNWTLFWVGAVSLKNRTLVGWLMKKAGLGKKPA
mgnify:CR=1 FL=1